MKNQKPPSAKAAMNAIPAPEKTDSDMQMETKQHMNTLLDAHEIMNNPDKMAKVKSMVGRHKKAITSLDDLRETANNFSKNNSQDDGEE